MSPLTWACHACDAWREDEWISVAKHRFMLPPFDVPVVIQLRYCNDRPDCLARVAAILDEKGRAIFNANCPKGVHVLAMGGALCGRLRGVPGQWPDGHTWIGLPHVLDSAEMRAKVTCVFCARRLEDG